MRKRDRAFELVYQQIDTLIKDGYTDFAFGNYGEFEDTARIAVISLKQRNPHIKTVYYQTYRSAPADYERLQRKYDEVIPPIEDARRTATTYLNQTMIELSNFCIFYVTNKTGVLPEALQYAIKRNKPHINLADLIKEYLPL